MEPIIYICITEEKAIGIKNDMFHLLEKQGYVTHKDFTKICGYYSEIFEDPMYDLWGWYELADLIIDKDVGDNWFVQTPELVKFTEGGEVL